LYNSCMPSVAQILEMRRQRQSRYRRNPAGKLGLGCSLMVGLALALGVMLSALAYTDLTQGLPSLEALPALLEPPDGALLQPTLILDRTGQHVLARLENPVAANKQYLLYAPGVSDTNLAILPAGLISATLAADDPTFRTNWGFSYGGVSQEAHTTLAQKLVISLLLWNEPAGQRRALRERLLAMQITSRFGREKVLEWYLNSAYYGHLAYGADAASRVYFGKPGAKLSLAEAAVLAAVADTPSLNPLDAPQVAQERGRALIQKMASLGFIQKASAERALQEKVVFQPPSQSSEQPLEAFANLVVDQLTGQIPPQRLERGGLRIITTLDNELQKQAACAVGVQLDRLGSKPNETASSDCPVALLLPSTPGADISNLSNLQTNVVILDPARGQILALVGASNALPAPTHLNAHPPGSLLTPFIYLTGFTRGMSPATLLWDIPSERPDTSVANPDGQFHGPLRLRTALANDYLVPAMHVLAQLGADSVWRTAEQMGMTSLSAVSGDTANRLPLEGGSASLLETTQAFGVLANQGVLVGRSLGEANNAPLLPQIVLNVLDPSGRLWVNWETPQTRPVISPQLAYLMTNVLSDEAARWPSLGHPNALEIGRPAAAKLGRTVEEQDAWAVGYTPQLAVGVWLGIPQARGEAPKPTKVPTSGAAALWHALLQYASRDLPPQGWQQPPGVTTLDVCDPSGLLPTSDCPTVVSEVFLAGNEPTQPDNLYHSVEIDRETGQLATIFTPRDLVERKVFMTVPPEAQQWARNAGLPIAPENYDVIASNTPTNPNIHLDSPAIFAYVRGVVPVMGTASGPGFNFYRVQVGAGLNPQQWLQLGEDSSTPVEGGKLATWDTSNLSGLYTLQLLVVRQDQRVESTVLPVTIDNQPPQVSIQYPANGQTLALPPSHTVTFQIDASDDLALNELQVYVDQSLVATLTQVPFAIPWQASPGQHTIRAVATDKAGNSSETTATFILK
jgi:membrane peptidoglycan carboxypeptidase